MFLHKWDKKFDSCFRDLRYSDSDIMKKPSRLVKIVVCVNTLSLNTLCIGNISAVLKEK